MTIEELEIVIKANIKDALKGLQDVVKATKEAVRETNNVTSKVTTSVSQIATQANNSYNTASRGIGKYVKNLKSAEKQQQYIAERIKELQYQLSQADLGFEVGDTMKMEAEVEKLTNQLRQLEGQQNRVSSKDTFDGVGKSLKSSLKHIGRYTLALIGIRSIYMGIKEIAMQWLGQNEELAGQLDYMKFAIGEALAPVIEMIIQGIYKALVYIGALIKVMTGVNVFAQSYDKYMKNAAKSTGQISKNLSGIDEITNLDSATGGTQAGVSLSVPNLAEDVDEMAKVNKEIQGLGETLYDLGTIAVGVWGFIKQFVSDFVVAVEGLVVVVETVIASIAGILDGGITMIVSWIWSSISSIGQILWGIVEVIANILGIIGLSIWGVIETVISVVGGAIQTIVEIITTFVNGEWSTLGERIGNIWSKVGENIKNTWKNITGYISKLWQNVINGLNNIWKGFANFFIGIWNGVVRGLNKVIRWINAIQIPDAIAKVFGASGGRLFNIGYISEVSYLANGGVLDQPTFAMVGEYPGAKSNPEIVSPQNIMYETMLDALSNSGSNGSLVINIGNKTLYKGTIEELRRQSYLKNGSEVVAV